MHIKQEGEKVCSVVTMLGVWIKEQPVVNIGEMCHTYDSGIYDIFSQPHITNFIKTIGSDRLHQ